MSSSESARLVLLAVWLVAVLVLSSAMLRVLAGSPPRSRRYVVAWLVSTLVLGGLLFLMDKMLATVDWSRQLANLRLAGIVSAVGLVAGSLLARLSFWTRQRGAVRFVVLVLVQAAIVFVVGYPFL